MTDTPERSPTDEPDEEPLGDLVEAVNQRRRHTDAAEDAFEEQPFEEMDVESVLDQRSGSSGVVRGALDDITQEGEDTYVVSKRTFCEDCKHLSDPPDIRCTHPDAEIIDFVDLERVRVRSCPVVENELQLLEGTRE